VQDQKTLTAGATVQGGYYVNRDKPDLVAIAGLGGTLPGDEGQRYFRAPAWAVLALAPLLGGLFLVLRALVGLSRLVPRLGRWFGSATNRAGRAGGDGAAEPACDFGGGRGHSASGPLRDRVARP
jgi:hypothetical protein